MELMSSSEDESNESTRDPFPAQHEHLKPSVSHDSLEKELLSPSTRVRANDRTGTAVKACQKPVISARELLMNFRPPQQNENVSPARETVINAAVAAYSMVTPKKHVTSLVTEKKEKELSVSERIAQKYGFVATAKTPPTELTLSRFSSGSTSSHPTRCSTKCEDDKVGKNAMPQMLANVTSKTRKRSFWDVQVEDECTKELTAEASAMSPFSNSGEYTVMKQKRQRRLQAADVMAGSVMGFSRKGYSDDINGKVWAARPRPQHVFGSALPSIDDDTDEWMSDLKEAPSSNQTISSNVIVADAILGKRGDYRDKDAWRVLLHQRRERFNDSDCMGHPEDWGISFAAVKAILCRKKLGLTGTLMQNNEKELHCLVDTIAPGAIGSWVEFSMYYGNDIKYGRKKSAAPEAVQRSRHKEKELRRKLRPYYLRREKEVNPTFREVKKNDQVVFCDLTPLQMAAYRRILAMPEFQLLRRGEEKCDCGRDSSEKRKKCCYKTPKDVSDAPGLLYERFHDDKPCGNCPNCMCLPCVAMLLKLSNHLELLKVNPRDGSEIQQYQAEFARTAFGSDLDAVGGVNQVSSFQEMCSISTKACGKMIVLEKLLSVWKKRRERALIFSRSTRMLDIIQLFIIAKATRYSRLDGTTKVEERLQMINDFNNPDSNTTVFLISTRAGGVGLNLQSATNVVIFDPSWNPAHDCQAQDRAYRIGQTKDVQVYRLITLGTIEEMIYVRQIYKQQLSDTTLKGANAPRYFEGVQGNPHQRGELFGIANLIDWKPGGVLKGIQDAYQRSRDGLIVQQNRVRYDAVPMRKPTKKSSTKNRPSTVDNDDGEMIEVADEIVSEMTIPEDSRAPIPAKEMAAAISSDTCGKDMDALLNETSKFRHIEILSKLEDEQNDETGDVRLDGNVEASENSKPEPDALSPCRCSPKKHANNQHTSPLSRSDLHGSVILSEKDAKRCDDDPTLDKKPHRTLYVPGYL
uniref:Helicase C-terminal domain-containing protein n=1 Tax=Hyaloperonospora arabidopsidis (strain Emoy2) TaxID=559515 RepID=M4BF79_HYAAE